MDGALKFGGSDPDLSRDNLPDLWPGHSNQPFDAHMRLLFLKFFFSLHRFRTSKNLFLIYHPPWDLSSCIPTPSFIMPVKPLTQTSSV